MTACSQEKKKEHKEEQKSEFDFACRISGSVAPEWVCTSDDKNPETISAVGMATPSTGDSFQRKMAIANARTALVDKMYVKIAILKESKVVDMWVEPKSKDLYLLVAVPK
jgi:hypothetical protein